MSDLNVDDGALQGGSVSEGGEDGLPDLDSPTTESRKSPGESRKTTEREGLPANYRMRADAHYVDQLSARSSDVPLRFLPIAEIDHPELADASERSDLQALVQSVAEHGIVQPLLVRRDGNRYRLIAGRRRLAAARSAALARVPCLVYQVADTQADALALASNVRMEEPVVAGTPDVPAGYRDAVVTSVTESVNGIQSATDRLSRDGSPMARRVALDLVRAEAWRAAWLLQAAAILEGRHAWRFGPVVLGTALGRVRDGFAAERRLGEIDVRVSILDWNVTAELDEDAVVTAITGAVIATAGLLKGQDVREITLVAKRPEGKILSVEVTTTAVTADAFTAKRVFDPAWTDRPGGWPAVVGAMLAQTVAERHGGTATFVATQGRGSTVKLTLGRSIHTSGH